MLKWLIIALTLLGALILMVLPMPIWSQWLRPAWVLLVLMCWALALPNVVSVGVAWLVGLIVDLLSGCVLGEHALAYTVVIYCVVKIELRFNMYSLLQQCLVTLGLILGYLLIIYFIQGFMGELPRSSLYWAAALTSTLAWPWLFVLLGGLRQRFGML